MFCVGCVFIFSLITAFSYGFSLKKIRSFLVCLLFRIFGGVLLALYIVDIIDLISLHSNKLRITTTRARAGARTPTFASWGSCE